MKKRSFLKVFLFFLLPSIGFLILVHYWPALVDLYFPRLKTADVRYITLAQKTAETLFWVSVALVFVSLVSYFPRRSSHGSASRPRFRPSCGISSAMGFLLSPWR